MQVHNLVDWKTHLDTLFKWKSQGKVRYVGITHYLESAYGKMESIMKNYPLDFIQVNLSLGARNSQNRLLPLAADRGQSVIINRPFSGGDLFRVVQGRVLPEWASECGIDSWAQLFLKYVISNPSVTCAIPGTSQAPHMAENLSTGTGALLNAHRRKRMEQYFDNL
jgi:diketogulonate reductase-like aldo/keto reductase